MKNIFIPLLALILLAGCARHTTQETSNQPAFNREEAMMMLEEGSSTIKGSAALQTAAGIVTCGGNEVELTPVTPYASQKMVDIFGNNEIGFLPEYQPTNTSFNADFASYGQRKTMCDPLGNFQFNNVKQGDYFVSAYLSGANGQRGGYIMRKVKVGDQETRDVVFSQNEWKSRP